MASYKINASGGLRIPVLSADPASPENGAIWYNSTANVFKKCENGVVSVFGGDSIDADQVVYDNATSGLSATDAQGAIDELASDLGSANTAIGTIQSDISEIQSDIIDIQGDISDIQSNYIPLTQKGAANGVATLGADQKIPASQIPAMAITETFVVADEAARLALDAQIGDVAIQTDVSKTYILQGSDPTESADWVELQTPASPVQSVNGQVGIVVLDSDDVAEGSANLYFTDARARTAAVLNTLAGSETDQAPSVAAVNTALAGKLSAVVEDTSPVLGGTLNTDGRNIIGGLNLATASEDLVERTQVYSATLNASGNTTINLGGKTPAIIEYAIGIPSGTSQKIGTLIISYDGTTKQINEQYVSQGPDVFTFTLSGTDDNIDGLIVNNAGSSTPTIKFKHKTYS